MTCSSGRPAGLFRLGGGDAEKAHECTLRRLAGCPGSRRCWPLRGGMPSTGRSRCSGCGSPNPVGLAAGMDKNGVALPAWPALGFGFVEVGTVTAHAAAGQRPAAAVPAAATARRSSTGWASTTRARPRWPPGWPRSAPLGVPLGISLGKSKVTPLEEAVEDYLTSYGLLHPYADYFAVNVSSPNTPGLRTCRTEVAHLAALLGARWSGQRSRCW